MAAVTGLVNDWPSLSSTDTLERISSGKRRESSSLSTISIRWLTDRISAAWIASPVTSSGPTCPRTTRAARGKASAYWASSALAGV
ncbi:hypothetical protein D9M68_957330 [compost metagenome]